ncbi:MAG: glycosyltransferase [Bradyrhizobiaceae bacterium]|nr:glycosyltransferase [Bradyrhizobiaceae bacterium]
MPNVVFAVPGDLQTPTGGYIYDRRVIELLPEFGWRVRHVELPGDYPAPSKESLEETARLLGPVPASTLVVIDGLAFGAMPVDVVDRIGGRIVGLVHHPLALETGISEERTKYLAWTESAALERTVHVIVTSPATADLLASDFGVPRARISVAEPGTEAAPRARGGDGPPRLLSVGSVTVRKGYDTLVGALVQIADLAWENRIVGSLERDSEAVKTVQALIARHGLQERVALLGSLDEQVLAEEYDGARLFVLPSHFEGYGMAFAEALAHGLPVVGCAGGAVTSTVPADAGVLVPPGDVNALAAALRRLLSDPSELQRCADAAWRHAQQLPRWRDTAAKFARALDAALAEQRV